ncbi:MAG: RNA-binding cell elongation regulator Jag/EloR [Anaerolineae bacterium]
MASDETVVVEAPSVEEAIIIGLTRLTAMRDEVDIEVLDEGSRGFLGIGMRDARVRVTRRPERVEAAVSAEEVHEAEASVVKARPSQDAAQMEVRPSPAEEQVATTSEERGVEKPPQTFAGLKPAEPEPVAPLPETAPPVTAEQKEPPAPSRRERPESQGLDRDRVEAIARDIAENILPGLSIEPVIEWVDEDRPTIWISLEGRDADSLVGPRARNLHAVQYLFRSLIYHKHDGNYNVVVDADGYRKRRRRSLESLAEQKAERAVELGKTIRLRPMPAHERRIVHLSLRDDPRVTTESIGKGRDRAVTIIPQASSES